jgi:hypothetical protein
MIITLVQASVPPFDYYTWGGGEMFKLQTNAGTFSIVVKEGSYKNANQLAAAIHPATILHNVATTHSGSKLEFVRFAPFGEIPIKIVVQDEAVAVLTGLDLGDNLFVDLPPLTLTAPQDVDTSNAPDAVYLHTDMPTAQRNVDNIINTKARQGDIFAKIGIPDITQTTQFYENNSVSFHYHVQTDTLSSIGFYFRDLNNWRITPLKDWGVVLHVEFQKAETHHEVIQNSLLGQMVEYLRLMWLSNPPTSVRKSLTSS